LQHALVLDALGVKQFLAIRTLVHVRQEYVDFLVAEGAQIVFWQPLDLPEHVSGYGKGRGVFLPLEVVLRRYLALGTSSGWMFAHQTGFSGWIAVPTPQIQPDVVSLPLGRQRRLGQLVLQQVFLV
jgi:hypothetical protein